MKTWSWDLRGITRILLDAGGARRVPPFYL
jgi:hypothetical protein